MIIDIHRHLVAREWHSESFWKGYVRMVRQSAAGMGISLSIEDIERHLLPPLFDTTGEKHLAQMEKSGIDRSALFLWDHGLFTGEPAVSIQEQHRVLFEVADRYPGRFIPFAHIDPRRPGARDFVKKCIEEHGARGFKLLPIAGFNPEDPETMDIMELIAGYGLPVITHTGHAPNPASSRYCDPVYLDRMLLEFPDLVVIAAHMSLGYRPQLCTFAWFRPGLYTEISMSQFPARNNYPAFALAVREALDAFGPGRVMFGTDCPWLESVMDGSAFVRAVKELPVRAPDGLKFTEDEIDMLLGRNAQRLLGVGQ